jgi:uncharacterized protein YabE (DUF348 family)
MVSSSTQPKRQAPNRPVFGNKWQAGIVVALLIVVIASAAIFIVTRKQITLTVDGTTRRVVTHRSTVSGLLKDQRVQLAAKDEVLPALEAKLQKQGKVTVYRAVDILIKSDGQLQPFTTAKPTVKAALADAGVTLGKVDRVEPDLASPVAAGMKIIVHRVQQRTVVEKIVIPFPVLRRQDADLEKGKVKVVRVGQKGVKERAYSIIVEDGKQIKKALISEKVAKDPVPQLVAVGTKKVVRTLTTSRGATYRYNEMRSMVATAYDPGPASNPHGNGTTYLGLKAGYGIVAVDPRVIPLRSRLYIPGYGEALAGDTGGAIKGDRIDLGFNTYQDAMRFGRKRITVYVLE